MGVDKLQKIFLVASELDQHLPGQNNGRSPHTSSSFILVVGTGLLAIKYEDWDSIEWSIVWKFNSIVFQSFTISCTHAMQVMKINPLFPLIGKSGPI